MSKDRPVKTEIGAFEAKTRLPELLRQVRAGRRFTITNRGEAIADLVPSATGRPPDPRVAIEKFQEFLRENPIAAERRADLEALIGEGRE
jgi:prevent-host-death family protein